MSVLSLFLASIALMQSAAAEESARFQTCLETIETDPAAGYEFGLQWSYQGNRPAARQCTALALIELGQPAEGAARLETLANATDGGSLEQRAVYLTQAGNAWFQAGAPEAAELAFTNALKLSPQDPSLFIDRASARLAEEKFGDAIKDLDTALGLQPGNTTAHQLRAKAYLVLEQFDNAEADVRAAMQAEPENIDILLLRGDVREARRLSEENKIE